MHVVYVKTSLFSISRAAAGQPQGRASSTTRTPSMISYVLCLSRSSRQLYGVFIAHIADGIDMHPWYKCFRAPSQQIRWEVEVAGA